jgi:Zn finger protein HypA/HybF involved in hydrogenase expression
MSRHVTVSDFVERARQVHGDRYDYSQSVYVSARAKLKIVCPQHGLFMQSSNQHTRGRGCPKCGRQIVDKSRIKSFDYFLAKAKQVHGDRYDYSVAKYKSLKHKIEIVCPEHGAFIQNAGKHTRGQGCPKCRGHRISVSKSLTNDKFVIRAIEVNKGGYDYSKIQCCGMIKKIEIICPKHGSFWQSPDVHLRGCGCPACAQLVISEAHRLTKEEIIARFRSVHGDRYDYSEVQHVESHSPVIIICPEHGRFKQGQYQHYIGAGCPACAQGKTHSEGEDSLYAWVNSICPDAVQGDRSLIYPLELDILVPSCRIAIEYNGMYWHTSSIPSSSEEQAYHFKKFKACQEKGYSLFTVWEDDWQKRIDVIKHWLVHKFGKSARVCPARGCSLDMVEFKQSADFYAKYHLQGPASFSGISTGLFWNESLVACMTFSRSMAERKRVAGSGEFLLSRFAVAGAVPGAAGRLFKALVDATGATEVKTYSDNMYAAGGLYTLLGFKQESVSKPDYRVWHPYFGLRHKSFWQRKSIPQRLIDLEMAEQFDPETDARTEFEMCALMGCRHAWDAGKVRWVWRKQI